jgi:hypothetical protein
MELMARQFECHPIKSSACSLVSPLVEQLGEVQFTGRVGEKNSGQCDSDLDDRLAERFWGMRGVSNQSVEMPRVLKKFDFSFAQRGSLVVVEVEKANWEKVLYDFLKAHIYLASGAHFVVIFVPKNYVHSGKSPMKSFEKARQRYDHCLEYGFGSPENLGKIMLVGYEVALSDGRPYTPSLRKQFIETVRVQRKASQ